MTKETRDQVRAYALKKANLTEEALLSVRNHRVDPNPCTCDNCRKFDVFFHFRQTIEEWEEHKERAARQLAKPEPKA